MKYLTTILFFALCSIGASRAGGAGRTDTEGTQKAVLTTDETLPIPKLNFDPNGRINGAA